MDPAERVERLVGFARATLPSMRADDGAFCHEVAAPDPRPRGRSLRYTLIVLLGLLRAREANLEMPVDAGELKSLVLRELDADELTAGDLGLVLWADARSGGEAWGRALEALEERLARQDLRAGEGLEPAWILLGCAHAAAAGCRDPRAERLLASALERLEKRARTDSGLLLHTETSRRGRFPNFATQIYGVLALSDVSRLRENTSGIGLARRVADRLLALQWDHGGWPWIFDARRGTVVEPFEFYSVHQDAMAPMALLALSEASGADRYREAALHGLEWVFGRNELGTEMLDERVGILHRSIRRRPPLDRLFLYANTATAGLGRPLLARISGPLELNRTDRPYHLGWVLEAWAGQAQLPVPT